MLQSPRRGAFGLGVLGLCALALGGCDRGAEKKAALEARAKAAQAARQQAEQKAAAAQEQARARALAEEKAVEQSAALAKTAERALGTCCDALARRGFEERSMQDMAARRVCSEVVAKGDSLESARPMLTSALEGRALPSACAEPQ